MTQYRPTTVVMEACYSANYFGRLFESRGHTVKPVPAQHIKHFVRGNKNDANDAVAIFEASQRYNMRFIPVKTLEQQDGRFQAGCRLFQLKTSRSVILHLFGLIGRV